MFHSLERVEQCLLLKNVPRVCEIVTVTMDGAGKMMQKNACRKDYFCVTICLRSLVTFEIRTGILSTRGELKIKPYVDKTVKC